MNQTPADQILRATLRRRSLLGGLAGAAVTGLLAAGCAPDASSQASSGGGDPVTVDTAAGTLTLDAPASKVAALQFQFLDIMLSLGIQPEMLADDQVKGTATPLPKQYDGVLDAGYTSLGTREAPNLELLASQPVELILVDKSEHLKDKDQFDKYAPTGVFDTWQWAAFYANIAAVSTLLGKESEGADLAAKVKKTLSDTKSQLGKDAQQKALVTVATPDSMYAFTANSFQGGVIQELGFDYAYADKPGLLTEQVPLEVIADSAPDALLVTADAGAATVESTWKGNALWESIPAVKNGRVLHLDRGVWSLGRGPMAIDMMVDDVTKGMT